MAKKNIKLTGLNGNYNLGEQALFIIYDVESDKIRKKIFTICEDYGLSSIQYSTFFGTLSPNKYQELFLKLKDSTAKESKNIILIPVCNGDFKKILASGKSLSLYQKNFLEII